MVVGKWLRNNNEGATEGSHLEPQWCDPMMVVGLPSVLHLQQKVTSVHQSKVVGPVHVV